MSETPIEPQESLEPQENEERVALTILIGPNGAVRVNGMINDKVFAYGLLELAKEAISDYHKLKQTPKIVPVQGGMMNFVRNRLNGK